MELRMLGVTICQDYLEFPNPETIRERVQTFGATISGIVWVDKH